MWRNTPQTTLIRSLLDQMGHATNQQLIKAAHKTMPAMTATTVHRITTRLVEAGMAAYAPMNDGVKVIDSNTKPHDHFVCRGCGRIVDINLNDEVIAQLQAQIPGELAKESIVVTGICTTCNQ